MCKEPVWKYSGCECTKYVFKTDCHCSRIANGNPEIHDGICDYCSPISVANFKYAQAKADKALNALRLAEKRVKKAKEDANSHEEAARKALGAAENAKEELRIAKEEDPRDKGRVKRLEQSPETVSRPGITEQANPARGAVTRAQSKFRAAKATFDQARALAEAAKEDATRHWLHAEKKAGGDLLNYSSMVQNGSTLGRGE